MGAATLFVFAVIYPDSASGTFGSLFQLFAGLTLSISGLLYFIFSHGIDYVAWPRLNSLSSTILFRGRGHVSGRNGRGPWAYHSNLKAGTLSSTSEGKGSLQGVGAPGVTTSTQQRDWESGQSKKRVD